MPALHHALLGASVVALAVAGLRLASPLVERGLPRALAAAAFATALAVAQAMLLGLVALGGSTVALTIAALATGAAAIAWLPRPAVSATEELVGWWQARSLFERVVIGALVGGELAWAVWQLAYPGLGFDTIHYHLPEMVIFVQGGHPGSIHDVLPGLPVGNYPLATEVTVGWAMGIARSFVPLILWPWFTLTLMAASAFGGLRALGATRATAGLAAAALCTNPWLLAWQSNGSVTDPPALAWLVTCAGLTAMSRQRPALLVPAVVAAGLAIGGKTTVLPYTLLVLAIGLWPHLRKRQLPVKALALATALATVVGGFWYLRNLVTHGSPFWPIVATPWGDPVPHSVDVQNTTFLDYPSETIDTLKDAYLNRFGGALLLLGAAILAPLAARSRRVVLAAATTLVGLLIWARSPITGVNPGALLPETVFSTTRYALPVVAAACLTLALASTDARRRALRLIPLLVLAAAAVINLVLTLRQHFPVAPSGFTPLEGAVVGAAAAVLLRSRGRLRIPAPAVAVLAVVATTLLAIPASGFLHRHAHTESALVFPVEKRMVADPDFRNRDDPVATTPAYIGPLAGDELTHRLEAIRRTESCRDIAARARTQWLVVYGGTLGGVPPAAVRRCLPAPIFDNRQITLYKPTGG